MMNLSILQAAVALFDMIEYYESACRLNVSFNKIGPRGWQACGRMLKKVSKRALLTREG